MRVLHITRDYPPRWRGGLSSAVLGLVRATAELGIDPAIASFEGHGQRGVATAPTRSQCTQTGAPIWRVNGRCNESALAVELAAIAPAVVHVHHDLLWDLARRIAERASARTACTVHILHGRQDELHGLERPTASARAQDRALAQADRVLAPSQFVAAELAARVPGDRLRVAPLGGEPARIASPSPSRRGHDILFAGRFSDLGGLGDLIEALPDLLGLEPAPSIRIVGGLPDNPRGEARWREQIDRAAGDARDRVAQLGWLDPGGVAAACARARLIVIPSWIETFSLVALEAMSQGCAVAASDIPALRERAGDAAHYFAPRRPRELVATVRELWRRPDALDDLAARGRQRARASVWSAVVSSTVAVYRELTGSDAAGS